MFDHSTDNPRVPSFLRLVIAMECSVVFVAGVLLFFLPMLAEELWAWAIPPFNSRFVGAVYLAAYIPLIIFWFVPRLVPGRFTLWMILIFTSVVALAMFLHRDVFAWNRLATLIFWPLYIFLPINSAIFVWRSEDQGISKGYDGTVGLGRVLLVLALLGGSYGLGLLIAPEFLTRFWPWPVDAFHGRMYAAAFITPALAAWILRSRRPFPAEYLSLGLNLIAGGLLPVLGTLWTNLQVPAERQISFSAPGTWMFFSIFLLTAAFGAVLTARAFQLTHETSVALS